jgi:putative tryptophan/tyrosine transport system substrate-binding protein
MRLIGLAVVLALSLVLSPHVAEGQPPGKVARVGWLNTASPGSLDEAFRLGIRQLGYVEGQNIAIEWRWVEGRFDRLPSAAAGLANLGVDIILAGGTPAALVAQKTTVTIPIVMVVAADHVAAGLVTSLGRPGGNITGLTRISPELAGKRLELLKETLPKLSRVAVLWHDASNPATASLLQGTHVAAEAAKLGLQSVEVRSPSDLDGAFKAMIKGRAGAVIVLQDGLTIAHRARIVDLAAQHQLPAMFEVRDWTTAGGFMAYGANDLDLYRRAAFYVDKILKGSKPADLPVEQPTKFELVINLKTAKTLGLTIPQTLLLRADQVIE